MLQGKRKHKRKHKKEEKKKIDLCTCAYACVMVEIRIVVFVLGLASLVRTRLKAGNQTRGVFNELIHREALIHSPNL